jgi:hypothetical protein
MIKPSMARHLLYLLMRPQEHALQKDTGNHTEAHERLVKVRLDSEEARRIM